MQSLPDPVAWLESEFDRTVERHAQLWDMDEVSTESFVELDALMSAVVRRPVIELIDDDDEWDVTDAKARWPEPFEYDLIDSDDPDARGSEL